VLRRTVMYSSKPACDPNHDAALKLIVSGASSNSFCSTNLNNSKALVTDLLESARLRTPKADNKENHLLIEAHNLPEGAHEHGLRAADPALAQRNCGLAEPDRQRQGVLRAHSGAGAVHRLSAQRWRGYPTLAVFS